MTKLLHVSPQRNRVQAPSVIFAACNQQYGPLATWQDGQTFGGTSAYVLLGPDIPTLTGRTNLQAQALGPGWELPWHNAPPGPGPVLPFCQDAAHRWVRGHLVNAEWGGSGLNWQNLTPLTAQANSNHKTVENGIRRYLEAFNGFENGSAYRDYWFAVQYWVQVSRDPWAAVPAPNNLYSYCPNMIKVTWRVVTIRKPEVTLSHPDPVARAQSHISTTEPDPVLGWQISRNIPTLESLDLPEALTDNPANRKELRGEVHPIPPRAPGIPFEFRPFDGSVEIFQD